MSIDFASDFVAPFEGRLSLDLVRDVTALVERPYTSDDHAQLSDIQQQLHSGVVVDTDPVLVLNALWATVASQGKYANEIAILLSLLPTWMLR
ncbi:MAG: hypothetical protein IIC02_11545 [Planctomycetes bacterium]|nr:hypothetical protein [Planctomycetota bacterium]